MAHEVFFPVKRRLGGRGFEATDKLWFAQALTGHQVVKRALENRGEGWRLLDDGVGWVSWVVNDLHERVGGASKHVLNVLGQSVLVLFEKVDGCVRHWTSVVFHGEHHVPFGPGSLEGLGRVRSQGCRALLGEGQVRGLWEPGLFVEDGKDGALLARNKSSVDWLSENEILETSTPSRL